MNIQEINRQIEARPTPTPAMWDAVHALVLTQAPDVYDYLFGSAS